MTTTAVIRKLTIQRFRGLEKFDWHPQPGMNVVLGGGDVGKTTVLEAIALLLSPSNATVVSESDYWQRDSTQEFVIEAVMTLQEATGISSQHNFSWPWAWNGQDAVAPSATEEDDLSGSAGLSVPTRPSQKSRANAHIRALRRPSAFSAASTRPKALNAITCCLWRAIKLSSQRPPMQNAKCT